ncbi:MAG TPA: S8 family serine peptidase [Chloroflexia bacterium]|nr:S8 family serine peptidase [Chloroflexia bacterium]
MRSLKVRRRGRASVSLALLLAICLTTFSAPALFAADSGLPGKAASASVSSDLLNASGKVTVALQLTEQPLVLTPGQDRAAQLKASQDNLVSRLAKYNVKELARLTHALNAVVVEVDASQVQAMANEYNVKAIDKVNDYQLADKDTNGLIGATAAQQMGYNGAGTTVAVLDSGVDYTHKDLGGPGTVAAYNDCYAQRAVATYAALSASCKALFGPGAPKVVDGYDFVGESWPNGPLAPDANPIDFEGHGTHVSDIIAGVNPDFPGVAPGAKVIAGKVCSAVATSCSGVAILEGLDYAAAKKVDIVNMSLGSSYGQQESAEVKAVENLTAAGILVVISAGNSADKPYIVGSASTAPGALSVAQTAVPSDKLYPIDLNRPGLGTYRIKYSVAQPWAPVLTAPVSGPVQYGDGAGGNLNGCAAYPAGTFSGKIAFIDRGVCAISVKVSNADAAGAKAVIIGLVAPGNPSVFSYGGGTVTTPAFVISQADGDLIRTAPAGSTATIDPANAIGLSGTMIGSSSRGPSISDQSIKPEIGAPGGSVSAVAGTGTGTDAFSGTSGAAPMVSGSALLVKQMLKSRFPGKSFTPTDIKGFLMNTAETNISTLDASANFYPTPITRIGAGEVRVNRAVNNNLLVTVPSAEGAAVSFGYTTVANTTKVFYKTIRIRNLTNQGRLYTISATFRDQTDNNGAVVFQSGFPRNEWVEGNSYRDITIQIQVNGQKLKPWNLDAGSGGGDGTTINGPEYDGYIKVDGGAADQKATLPWQIFPHKAADTQVRTTYQGWVNGPVKVIQFANDLGIVPGKVETFQLLGTSPQLSGPPPALGSDEARIDLKAFGVRDVGGNLQFAMSTYGQRATPNYPAEFDVYIDANNDGTPDYVAYNAECGSFGTDGRNCVNLINLATGRGGAVAFSIATYNSGNIIFSIPLSALGLSSGTKIGALVQGCDNYFTGNCTDAITGPSKGGFATYTVGKPAFSLQALPWAPFPAGQDGNTFFVTNNGFQVGTKVAPAYSSLSTATGFLFMYSDADNPNRESETVPMP